MEIVYPYLPKGKRFYYVPLTHHIMLYARAYAREHSKDEAMPCASVIVWRQKILGAGANGSDYHKKNGCRRVLRGSKTGEDYELCRGCHPRNHSEPKAIKSVLKKKFSVRGTDLYMWGHWWCCKSCWNKMIRYGIERVYLLEGSHILFNKEHPDNVIGRQFDL